MDVQPDGSAEQDPLEYANALRLVCESCGKFAAENRLRIAALSFTSQRSSILPLDSSGKPLSRIITWYDKRSADICRRMLELHGDEIYRIAGMRPIPVLSAPKIAWLKETHPDIYRNAHKIVGIHDYLLYLATGKFVTDDTLASRTCLMDTASRQWSPRLLALFDISQDKLCTLLPAGSIAGTVTQTFAAKTCLAVGIPVISAGGDQQCSVLGQGLLQPGQAGITVGTGAYLAGVTDHPINDPEKRVNINAAVTPGHWILEASTLSAGAVYDWVNRLFSDWEGKGGRDSAFKRRGRAKSSGCQRRCNAARPCRKRLPGMERLGQGAILQSELFYHPRRYGQSRSGRCRSRNCPVPPDSPESGCKGCFGPCYRRISQILFIRSNISGYA